MRVMYLCIHSARLHDTVTSHKSKGSNNKKHQKKEQQQQQQQQQSHQEYNSDDDTTTKAACPGAAGAAPARLTDPNPGQGHITSVSPSHGGQKLSSRFCNLREAEPAFREGALNYRRETEANKTKAQHRGCLWSQGRRVPLPVICRV